MDQCCLFHLTCAQGNGFYSPPPPSTGDTPFEAQLFMNRQMQLFMKLIIEEKWIRRGRGREREWGKGLKRYRERRQRQRDVFFSYRIVNHKPADQWRAGLLTLFCFHSSHFPSTFLSFSSAFSTSTMVTSFTVHSALYLPPPSQVSLLPWQQQTSEWII